MDIMTKRALKLLPMSLFMGMLFAMPLNIKSQGTPEKTLEDTIKNKISLEVSSVFGQPSSVLEFIIKNNSDQIVLMDNLNEGGNFTFMQNPKGSMLAQVEYVNLLPEGIEARKIKPLEKKSWRYDITQGIWFNYSYSNFGEFSEDAGIYSLYGWARAQVVYADQNEKRKNKSLTSIKYLLGPIHFIKEQKTEGIIKVPHYDEVINGKTRTYQEILENEGKNKPGLLNINRILYQPSTLLEFTLANSIKEEIKTSAICTNYNKIVIVKPNGEEKECFTAAKEKDIKTITIKPDEKQSWRIDLLQIGKDYGVSFDEPGTYKVYWKLINDKGETKEEIKSDPILFLKETEKKEPPKDK